MHRSPAALAAFVLLAGGLAACSEDLVQPYSSSATPIEWTVWNDGSADVAGTETGTLAVPIDYADPSKGSFDLYVTRHEAMKPDERIGSLLVNPGGPGFGGSDFALYADQIYGQDLLDRFDIIGFDPRGTGLTTPAIDCIDDYDPFFGIDSSPDDETERDTLIATGVRFGEACRDRSGTILPYVGTENSARDMDSIRQALGEETISYFGFSYGSELGATWLTMFPTTVRAAVLDGAVDPTVGYLQQNIQQATGFNTTFTTFLAQCSDDETCAFNNDGDAEGAYDALRKAIDDEPLLSVDGRTAVTDGVLNTAVADAMYLEEMWPQLADALAAAQDGDGAGLLALYDDYYVRNGDGTYDNSLEAYFAIGCLDDPGSTGPDDLFGHEKEFDAAAPYLGRGWMAELTFCSVWPEKPAAPFVITGAGAGPVVVVGTTGDPATPLDSTRNMANALEDGRLIIVTADQHTGYGVNDCVDTAVDDYLVDPSNPPADETACE